MNNEGQDTTPPVPSSSEVAIGVRIDRICGEFEDRLKAGESPRIEEYFDDFPASHHPTLLRELLGLELDYRAKSGDSFTSEEYTLRFPEHASTVSEMVYQSRQEKPADQDSESSERSSDSATTQRTPRPDSKVRIGPYQILEPCGRGGMGVVYKAWHEFFKQHRAIKVLPSDFDDDDINRFSMEIELAGRLNHRNIVRAHEANREQGVLYLVMEYVDGITLDHLVKHHKQLPLGLACEMVRQAAEGLQHAHEHFLVHRDIKPSNLMINQKGEVKILDFGLARLHAEQNASRLTKHGSLMGTLDFMAPEQWEDPMAATIQADIYSLGCTLFYMVTGTPPYGGESYSHWLKKQDAHRQKPIPTLEHEQGEHLQPILNRMMAKTREERYTTPQEIVDALAELSDPSELKLYAGTPSPAIKGSGISRAPIPTVNVSHTDVLNQRNLADLANRMSPDDSEVNSKEKTLRPNQSRTDWETGRPQQLVQPAPSPAPRSRVRTWMMVGVAVLALAGFGAWQAFSTVHNPALAEQMGALPALNGGLNGDWWFVETPWYGPPLRMELMKAIRRGEDEIAGVSLANLSDRAASADTEALHADLLEIAEELTNRLPERSRNVAGSLLVIAGSEKGFQDKFTKIASEFNDLEEALNRGYSATELHFYANVLHAMSATNSELATTAEQLYQSAIDAYDEDDEIESVLKGVALADHSRFHADRKNYSDSINRAGQAAALLPNAALFQISLKCQLADRYRKWENNSEKALEQIEGETDSARVWADRMQLAQKHPLRAEILERKAWINVDRWRMHQASQDFDKATKIREANQDKDNTFAWRPMLLNLQGKAMALHYLGLDDVTQDAGGHDKDGAIATYNKLIEQITSTTETNFGTQAERNERLPNVLERFGDAYMFGPTVDYAEAAKKYDAAISASISEGFRNSATMWFHLVRMHYKHALALMLSSPEMSHAGVNEQFTAAQDLIASFQSKTNAETFEKQTAIFALEKQVAMAVHSLRESEDQTSLNELQSMLTSLQKSDVQRANIEVVLLAFQQVFVEKKTASKTESQTLGLQLLMVTDGMRTGDPAIRTKYLQPVLASAASWVNHEATREKLDAALPGE